MIVDKKSNMPYVPTPSYFLGGFDIYDREETLGLELEKYDPNSSEDREILIKNYCLGRYEHRSYREKYLLLKALKDCLENKAYDFAKLLEHDSEECSTLPSGWDHMDSPRVFFEGIYRLARIEWRDDLTKAEAEDSSGWKFL